VRLCLVCPGFSADEDDWCIPALHHLVRRLAFDHEVLVIALRYPHRSSEYGFHGATVRSLGMAEKTGVHRAALLTRALAAIRAEHRRRPLDAVHGLWADEAGFIAATAGRVLGIRSVVSVMGGELVGLPELGYGVQLGRTGSWLVNRGLAGADAITVGSTPLVEVVARTGGRRTATVTPLGVETALFHPDGGRTRLSGDPCLLHVGSLVPVKNHRLLLAAFAVVIEGQPSARLHLVGDGLLRDRITAEAHELGLGDRIRLHGHLPHHELPELYRAADLHLQTSVFESQGMAVLEAAACATPTFGTDTGILPDLGNAAITASAEDVETFGGGLANALSGSDRLCELGLAASALVQTELDLESCVARLESVYSAHENGWSPSSQGA
jgi:glycosyltransferase involved in cell wall biosynthesis